MVPYPQATLDMTSDGLQQGPITRGVNPREDVIVSRISGHMNVSARQVYFSMLFCRI
jgi:hypothetical protein